MFTATAAGWIPAPALAGVRTPSCKPGLAGAAGSRPLTRLDAAALERLARHTGRSMLLLPGTLLVHRGHPFYDLYVVRSGCIRASVTGLTGRVTLLRDYLPGEIIGLDALRKGRYPADFTALGSATVCPLPLDLLADMTARRHG